MAEQKDKCPECEGRKVINIDDEPVHWKDCPICHGTGEKKLDSPDMVKIAKSNAVGMGLIPPDSPREKIAKVQRCLRNCRLYPSLCRKFLRCKVEMDTVDYEMADQIIALFPDVEKLEAAIKAFQRARIGEVWYWQGDGEDHLESLTCPVLIDAQELRALIEEAKTQERGRILDEMIPHDEYWRMMPEHRWQALKGE